MKVRTRPGVEAVELAPPLPSPPLPLELELVAPPLEAPPHLELLLGDVEVAPARAADALVELLWRRQLLARAPRIEARHARLLLRSGRPGRQLGGRVVAKAPRAPLEAGEEVHLGDDAAAARAQLATHGRRGLQRGLVRKARREGGALRRCLSLRGRDDRANSSALTMGERRLLALRHGVLQPVALLGAGLGIVEPLAKLVEPLPTAGLSQLCQAVPVALAASMLRGLVSPPLSRIGRHGRGVLQCS